ncbi:hypothetical protein V6C53_08805 [Desulfocurvibacter africanus]|uniref:Ferritin-like domain-containing protein n=1 Tax=Desulfocurvibacter africanus subsp. africanus str. Walvis Bay TaxID=690850 RepID=F3YVD6_DESAF|nr:hypothetical protein [Desulfocurvibacter africanus]EGJ48528.1 hypothetical protein Desaf_0168 [Desulfocurvibacter africanus subsp. africanus str. Walvis Bay]
MAFNPFKEKGLPAEKQYTNWNTLNVKPYDKGAIDPYTRCRVILVNGAEFEANWFGHQWARHCDDPEAKRQIAMTRRLEQMQQKMVSALVPANESVLEHTIGYEQVAVDLTAWLARHEPDPLVKAGLDFALLEDFDHLYRYANLLEMRQGIKAETLVGKYTEIIPGRPTIAEHRHPFDDVRNHYDATKADIRTKLNSMTIVAAEQQTMNYYMNQANRLEDTVGRGLYSEIGMIEEQHVTHYESLLDPTLSWNMMHVMHEYNECYLYWSCMQTESDARIKKIWENHLEMEIGHLHAAVELMKRVEGKDPVSEFPNAFPEPLTFESNVDYVRNILAEQENLTANLADYVPMSSLPKDHRYFQVQQIINEGGTPSQQVITEHIEKMGKDYRWELAGAHPVERLRERERAVA